MRVLSGGERAALAVAPLALIAVSSCLRPSTVDTLALRPDGHQHEQQPGRDGRGGWRRRHDLVRRLGPEKNSDPLLVVSVLSRLAEFTLCKICKIRQVVFTTFLNWLLKTSLKKNLHRGAKRGKVASRERCSLPRRERGLNFRDYSRFSRLGFTPRTIWYSTMFLPKVLRLRVAFAINNNLNMKLRNSDVVQLSAIVQL